MELSSGGGFRAAAHGNAVRETMIRDKARARIVAGLIGFLLSLSKNNYATVIVISTYTERGAERR
jgi:hypothetical protein